MIDPTLTDEQKTKIEHLVFDVQKEETDIERKRIQSMSIHYKSLKLDQNNAFFAFCLLYVDGLGYLQKKLLDFGDLTDAPEKKLLAERWINAHHLPPADVKFLCVKNGGNFTIALDTNGNLWTRGFTESGSWDEVERFSLFPKFKANEEGLLMSSLGPGAVMEFVFDNVHAIIILDNGAVFCFGSIQEFQSYGLSGVQMGFCELTDSTVFKPHFIDPLCGEEDKSEGPYGIFGNHKPVKYFRRMNAFLDENGVPIIRVISDINPKTPFFYTPVDPRLFFRGERIIHMNHHLDDLYVTASGKLYAVSSKRATAGIVPLLRSPKAIRQLPFPTELFRLAMFTTHTHTTIMRADGRLFTVPLDKSDTPDQDVTDVPTHFATDEKVKLPLTLKHFAHSSLNYYYLFE
jgi:hypothetical protein